MKEGNILVGFDILGHPYLLDACKTNESSSNISDYNLLIYEYEKFNNWDEVLQVAGTPNTIKNTHLL